MSYPEYKNINYSELAEAIQEFWEHSEVYKYSLESKKQKKTFVFYEGPPSANGRPGIHHVMARTIKDIFCRYKALRGYHVERKGGWDTHGLPVELQVEKELGITKEDIGKKITVKEYNEKCRSTVMTYKNQWDTLTKKMGYWLDLENPYITFDRKYIESVWYLLKQLFDKGLLYKGYTVQPYSPAAGTGISSHELNQPGTYKNIKDTSIVAQFKIKKDEKSSFLFDDEKEDVRFLAWTTTPWTLPSNCALAVGKCITYIKVKTYNPYTYSPISVILARELVDKYFSPKAKNLSLDSYTPKDKWIPYQLMELYKGEFLLDIRYEQLMNYVSSDELEKRAFRIITGDFVSTEDGTGIVHIASVFGADDFSAAKQANIPHVMVTNEKGEEEPLVDKQGKFVKEVKDFAGGYVKEEYYDEEERKKPDFKPTDVLIAIHLKENNKAFLVQKYEHSYPHCWRTDKPILYYPLNSWFVKTTAVKDQLVSTNRKINWKPETTGSRRFGNWLENLVDWNLSRSRYWGTPLPIWVTKDRSEIKCIGSFLELKEEIARAVEKGYMDAVLSPKFDPHRPYVDDIFLVSSKGEKMYREPDLIDVWFDSGAMPYAQYHYPFENREAFKENFPADFIAEGVDQTRGWFFTLHVISVLLFDQPAFRNVIANGLVLDKNGNKMSKRLGNAIDPFEVLKSYGPDSTRWYMIANSNPWDSLKFSKDGVLEVQKKFFATLTNTYSFFALYANLDNFNYVSSSTSPFSSHSILDRWILSRLKIMMADCVKSYEDYEPTQVARSIQDFINNQLSNWYVRLSRKRFWKSTMNEDKKAAYETLYECLKTTALLISPIAPFYADWLFKNLTDASASDTNHNSVHLDEIKNPNLKEVDHTLVENMGWVQTICSLVHSLRKKEKIKVRQPLQKILIPILDKKIKLGVKKLESLILSETNIKEIEYVEETSNVIIKQIKPNFKKLGSAYGPLLKQISQKINTLSQEEINRIEQQNKLELIIEGNAINLTLDDVEISSKDIPGWLVANEGKITVALDITVTTEMRKEGLVRDVVNRIQNFRKEKKFDVQQKINVNFYTTDSLMHNAIIDHMKYLKLETQANEVCYKEDLISPNSYEIDEFKIDFHITPC